MARSTAAKRVTVIGGGSGSFQILTGLKDIPGLEIRSIVSMMDNGGDSGVHRDDYGVLPPGDLRRCLVALSEETQLLRDLFQYRFEEGSLSGRSVGNLLMVALSQVLEDDRKALEAVSQLLKIRGEVVPVTWDRSHLHALLEDDTELVGERSIDSCNARRAAIASVRLEPVATANTRAEEVIADADFIVLGPGDLYTSVIANLLVEGIAQNVRESPARLIYMLNLMTKPGETDDMSAHDHVREIARYCGRVPDVVLAHAGTIPDDLRERYMAELARQVSVDENELCTLGVKQVVRRSLMSGHSYVRHDPQQVAAALQELMAVSNIERAVNAE